MIAQNKVVIEGLNIVSNARFCIVKYGKFQPTEEHFVKALKLGWTDKMNELPPEFEVVIFKKKTVADNKFAAVLNQMNDNGKDVDAIFNVDVTFKQPVEQLNTSQLLTAESEIIRATINSSTTKYDLVELGVTEFDMPKTTAERMSFKNLKLHLLNLLESQETLDIVSKMSSAAAQERKN